MEPHSGAKPNEETGAVYPLIVLVVACFVTLANVFITNHLVNANLNTQICPYILTTANRGILLPGVS